ncbi:MAG: hypothetical protein OHK0036_01240 [Bacteroidia bacterium]
MFRWIFWILIILWVLTKLKYLFEDKTETKSSNHQHSSDNFSHSQQSQKRLKNEAGDYVDYEEMKE